jgi:hypothetical protein
MKFTKVRFNDDLEKYFGLCAECGDWQEITPKECYAYINLLGVKCYGSDDEGFVIYAK